MNYQRRSLTALCIDGPSLAPFVRDEFSYAKSIEPVRQILDFSSTKSKVRPFLSFWLIKKKTTCFVVQNNELGKTLEMARPPRAEEASTRHVGFRLTDNEIEHLDQLVLELGFRDRSALLRAWLEQDGPTKRKTTRARTNQAPTNSSSSSSHTSSTPRTNHGQTASKQARKRSVATVHVEPQPTRKRHPRIIPTPRVMESNPSGETIEPKSIMRELLTELYRHKEPRLGLIRVADVVRALLPHASMETVHEALLTLNRNGLIELRPDGGTEFLKAEDLRVCPRGPRDTVFVYARLLDAR